MNVFIFGDSTTQEYSERFYPQQGWGYYLNDRFVDDVNIVNVAVAGHSLKSFLYSEDYIKGETYENHPERSEWNGIVNQIQNGDFVILYSGGINDMLQTGKDAYRPDGKGDYVLDAQNTSYESYFYLGKGLGTHSFFTLTSSVEEYTTLLYEMAETVKSKGAIPIVVQGTGKYYKVHDNDRNVVSAVRKYAAAVEDAAKRADVVYLDVGSEFEQEFSVIGYEKMLEKYFLSQKAYERFGKEKLIERKIPPVDDNVHYNLDGARRVAEIFIQKLRNTNCELAKYLR